jgi:tryptophan 2,3-dioxygenase
MWPQHAGVGGISVHAISASLEKRLGSEARDAVAAWAGSAPAGKGWPTDAAAFPFRQVLDHYRAVGRNAVSASLVGDLGLLKLSADQSGVNGAPARLNMWLRSATDQFDGDYHSYAGTALQEMFLDEASFGTRERTADVLIMALLLDLLRTEAEALAQAPSQPQRKRTQAMQHVVRRAGQLAPEAAAVTPKLPARSQADQPPASGGEAAELAGAAAAWLSQLPDAQRLADVTMLPTTVLHDEQMFLRLIQVFECLYLRAAWQIEAVAAALEREGPREAAASLLSTACCFAATPALYRVLTTMPTPAFAIIRAQTPGRSAIQSRAYREVENICAHRRHDRSADDVPRPTLEDAFLGARRRLPATAVAEVQEAMQRLDHYWRAMKRSHWGITLKIIGNVPGTGGTSGAAYLYDASRIPLFPALAAPVPPTSSRNF